MLNEIFDYAAMLNASDIHLLCGKKPYLRVNGDLRELDHFDVINDVCIEDMLERLGVKHHEKECAYDGAHTYKESRYRVHSYQSINGNVASLRIIPKTIPKIEHLNLPEAVESFTHYNKGLILVTGSTGSGKTTTLASLIQRINEEKKRNILTIEDPIEYIYQEGESLVIQREVGKNVDTYASAAKQAMREDPDIILLGELRDLDTIQNAITLAETGHLVFSTLHTKSAAESFDRMIDVFPGDKQKQIRYQLSTVIQGIVSQKLIKGKGDERVPACELMVVDDAIRNMIRERANANTFNDQLQMNHNKNGSQTFDQSLASLLKKGFISWEEAKKHTESIEELKRLVVE